MQLQFRRKTFDGRITMNLLNRCRCFMFFAIVLIVTPVASMATDNDAKQHPDISLPVKDYLLPAKTENIRESLNDPIFLACKEQATPIGKEGVLGVCTRYDDIYGQTDTVIYDSTDEILMPASHRSTAWIAITNSNTIHAPFGVLGFDVERIAGHYYRVVFWNADVSYWSVITHPDGE